MHRAELLEEIAGRYGVAAEYPWRRYPQYAVFRHAGNRKWFAVLMNPPGRKLGLATEDEVAMCGAAHDVDIMYMFNDRTWLDVWNDFNAFEIHKMIFSTCRFPSGRSISPATKKKPPPASPPTRRLPRQTCVSAGYTK